MRVYFAGCGGMMKDILSQKTDEELKEIYLLQTFAKNESWFVPYFKRMKDVILDSGAFTFMSGGKTKMTWDEYVEKYAYFIKKVGVKHFIELDIDSIVGYEEVKRLRKKLVFLTNAQPIPVWHKTRGKDEFLHMCDEFSYVALGGFAIKNWKRKDYKFIPWFINEAHKRNSEIHGLGFTNTTKLSTFKFDSVDSSTWTMGNRIGVAYKFDGKRIHLITRPDGTRVANRQLLAQHNFDEWLKFQQYAEEVL